MRIRQSCLPVRGISNLLVAEKLKIKREYFIKQQKQGSLISTRLPWYSYRLPGTRYEEHLSLLNAFPQVQAGIKVSGKTFILQFTFTDWNKLLSESLATSAGWTQQKKTWIRGWLFQAWMSYLIETVPWSSMKSFSPPHFYGTLSHSKFWKHLCSFFCCLLGNGIVSHNPSTPALL